MIEHLLSEGADVNSRADGGTTPLMIAAARGNLPIVQLLLDRGASPNLRDVDGWNAWAYANEKFEDEVEAFLIERG